MFRTVAKLAEAAGGEVLFGNPEGAAGAISTDTRKITPGSCFVALIGENHDAHAFIPEAISKGAGSVVVSKWDGPAPACAVIRVRDTQYALGELARRHRAKFDIPVVAISGSNGKTSTKEMAAAIFGRNRNVLKNKGNFNNLIGLPLTLLELEEEHQAAIVEMGINVPGEMERLAEIGSPTAGIITNVQPAHLMGLESLDRILEEKGRLWKSLRPDGIAVVNLDDRRLSEFAKALKVRKITYSLADPSADVYSPSKIAVSEGTTRFSIRYGGTDIPVSLPIMGEHHAQNALAAAAAALASGISTDDVGAGLAAFESAGQRMQILKLRNGCTVVDDTYNANPGSMLAAVEAVVAASSGKPLVAVLGEMRELGHESPALHFGVGQRIGSARASRLVTLGEMGSEIIKGAQAAGMDGSLCFHARNHEEAVEYLKRHMPECAWILVKGSRAMKMEKVVEGIAGEWL